MTKRISKFIVWIEEEDSGIDDIDVADNFMSLPGYVEHEWLDWTDA